MLLEYSCNENNRDVPHLISTKPNVPAASQPTNKQP
jgi:hypothetical protein